MDPTLIAAKAGVAGAIVGAVLGGVFALKAAKRQVEVMLRQRSSEDQEPEPYLYHLPFTITGFTIRALQVGAGA